MSLPRTAPRHPPVEGWRRPSSRVGPVMPLLGSTSLCVAPGPVKARQRGAALLLAMLTVTLVATLASAALWQQWRARVVETAERQRVQAGWMLTGALDWSRLILREDERNNQTRGDADHLGEPWAMPLEEARLSTFLAADRNNNTDELLPAFLSGEVRDQQSRLNFLNLVRRNGSGAQANAVVSEPDREAFERLYQQLNLPPAELDAAIEALRLTLLRSTQDTQPSPTALPPTRLEQLAWLGISRTSLAALAPHVTLLPEPTKVNLNTASAEVLGAVLPDLSLADAQSLVIGRARDPWRQLNDVARTLPALNGRLQPERHDVRSRYFEVRGRLRLDDVVIEERSLVVRNGLQVRVLWRERFTSQ